MAARKLQGAGGYFFKHVYVLTRGMARTIVTKKCTCEILSAGAPCGDGAYQVNGALLACAYGYVCSQNADGTDRIGH
ncbi:MAG TPA: hypothetical protein VJ860_13965 [Polyangia bacterium]|nr:hypothetical protein [Polyangia bacterium]